MVTPWPGVMGVVPRGEKWSDSSSSSEGRRDGTLQRWRDLTLTVFQQGRVQAGQFMCWLTGSWRSLLVALIFA